MLFFTASLCPTSAWGTRTALTAEAQTDRVPADYREVESHPEVGEGIQKYAADAQEGAQRNFGGQVVHDDEIFATFMADRFEIQGKEGEVSFALEAEYDLLLSQRLILQPRLETSAAVQEVEG